MNVEAGGDNHVPRRVVILTLSWVGPVLAVSVHQEASKGPVSSLGESLIRLRQTQCLAFTFRSPRYRSKGNKVGIIPISVEDCWQVDLTQVRP